MRLLANENILLAVEAAEIVLALFAQSADALDGYFLVVERDSFRRWPLPGTTGTE